MAQMAFCAVPLPCSLLSDVCYNGGIFEHYELLVAVPALHGCIEHSCMPEAFHFDWNKLNSKV